MIVLLFALLNNCFAGEISLSFDDAPRKSGSMFSGKERTKLIIEKLKNENIQAAFYINGINIKTAEDKQRIRSYSQSGHIIGNHTFSHFKLSETDLLHYKNDILKNDKILKQFLNHKKWIRFPYLNRGGSANTKSSIYAFLSEQRYFDAYITIDNYDWFMDALLERRIKSKYQFSIKDLCSTYSDILWEGILYYDEAARKYLDGSPKHVLLLHENDMAALCLDDLIKKIKNNNWKIISPIKAYSDKISNRVPDTLYLGQGRVAALIHEKLNLKMRSIWENENAIESEFEKRRIFTKKD